MPWSGEEVGLGDLNLRVSGRRMRVALLYEQEDIARLACCETLHEIVWEGLL